MPWNNQVLSTGSMLVIASILFFSSQTLVHAKDISGCCTKILVSSDGEAITHQSNRVGEYILSGVVADRPMYKNIDREEYLFYLMSKNKGLWMVGPKVNQFNGGLAHRGDTLCAEDVKAGDWKYTDGKAWHVDPTLNLTCIDRQAVDVECTYRDGVQFVGGDLPNEYGGGGIATSSDSSAECIQECENREGCKYWSWVEKDGPNCFLKIDKVQSVRVPKYVSGSIPSACISGPGPVEEEPSLESSCSYKDIQFVGGDISSLSIDSLNGCKEVCAEDPDCQLFTFYPQEVTNCFLKTGSAQAEVSTDAISGSVDQDCTDLVLPDINLTFEKNQINGKFKMDMPFREEYKDPNSVEYQKLAGSIEGYLRDMLEAEPEFAEQAVFDVRVVSFTPGSVVCNFKVNYVLREAYLAIPFAIKPTNITTAMNKNFKFRRGIIFQKFIIVAGSFKASAPVDHCSAKGCSHKCNYDYSLESYVCTCPPSLVLDLDQKTCVEPDQVGETTTYQPEIRVTVLPQDCLWSSWSKWSICNCQSKQSDRTRTIVTPAKNDGKCSGRYKEVKDCECDGDVPVTAIADSETEVDVGPTTEQADAVPTTEQDEVQTTVSTDEATEETSTDTTSVTFGDREMTTTEAAVMTTESVLMEESGDESTENIQVEGEVTTGSSKQDTDSTPKDIMTVANEEETTVVPDEQTTVISEDTGSTTADADYEYDDETFKPTESSEGNTDESTTTGNEIEIETESADTSSEPATELEFGSTDSPMESTTELDVNDNTTDNVASTEDAQAAEEEDMDSTTTEMSVEDLTGATELPVEGATTESAEGELPDDTQDSSTTEQIDNGVAEMTTEPVDIGSTEGESDDVLISGVTEKSIDETTEIGMTKETTVGMDDGEVTTSLDNIYDDEPDYEYDTTIYNEIDMDKAESSTEVDFATESGVDDVTEDSAVRAKEEVEDSVESETEDGVDSVTEAVVDRVTEDGASEDITTEDSVKSVTEDVVETVTEAVVEGVTEDVENITTEDSVESVTEDNVEIATEAVVEGVTEDGAGDDITTEDSVESVTEDGVEIVTEAVVDRATEDGAGEDITTEDNSDSVTEDGLETVTEDGAVTVKAADEDSTTEDGGDTASEDDVDSVSDKSTESATEDVGDSATEDVGDSATEAVTASATEARVDSVTEVNSDSAEATESNNTDDTTESDDAIDPTESNDADMEGVKEETESNDADLDDAKATTESDSAADIDMEPDSSTESVNDTTEAVDTKDSTAEEDDSPKDTTMLPDDVTSVNEATVEPTTQDADNTEEDGTTEISTDANDMEEVTDTETTEEADERIVFPGAEETTPGEGLTSLSQTKDKDDIDSNMITDTPRSFPDTSNMNSIEDDGEISTTVGYVNPEGTTSAPSEIETTVVPMAATVISIEEDETSVTITTVASVEKSTDGENTEDVTTAKPSMDEGEHEFDCEELAEGELSTTSEQIPMKCTQMDGSERRRVFLVISKSQVSADTLFAKNVKVVVKDLMVMSITPEKESSTS